VAGHARAANVLLADRRDAALTMAMPKPRSAVFGVRPAGMRMPRAVGARR